MTPKGGKVVPINRFKEMVSPARALATKSPMVKSKLLSGTLAMKTNSDSRGNLSSMASSFRGRSVTDVFSRGRLMSNMSTSLIQRTFGNKAQQNAGNSQNLSNRFGAGKVGA